MKVCHVISGDQWAGAEVMVFRLLQGLMKYKDVELFAIFFNDGKVAKEFHKLGVKSRIVKESTLNYVGFFNNVKCCIKSISPDILHSHRFKENISAYYSSGSENSARLVCTYHGMPEPLDGKGKKLKRFVLSKFHFQVLSKRFQRVVAVSEDIRDRFVREYGFSKGKVEMIHNGTEIPSLHKSEKDVDRFLIGSAGRLFPVKDYPFFVEIAREVMCQESGIRFELAGEGPEKEKIQGKIREGGLEEVFVLRGFVDDISKFYNSLDLYINTSLHEGLPMSVLEAMAYGIPIIAPDTGGLKEIIDNGHDGFLINDRDPKKYADACTRLFRDRGLLQQMGAASRRKVETEFSSDVMAERYYNLYQSL